MELPDCVSEAMRSNGIDIAEPEIVVGFDSPVPVVGVSTKPEPVSVSFESEFGSDAHEDSSP